VSTAPPTRIVVVDDHELVRAGMRGVLDTDEQLEVVGEAADGVQALAAVEVHRPDLVVMDLQMPGMGGVEATRRIVRAHPATAVLVVTMFDDDDSVFAAVRAGARGYVLKGANRDELKAAVRSVAAGQAVFGPGVASRVLDRMTRPVGVETEFPQLTPRERAVLELMVADLGPAAIARRLGIAVKTVRNNISSILTKLHVTERSAAVDAARSAGIGPVPDEGGDPTRGGR
jgi:DNA-binding NarL/FixJ family response regulator